MTIAEPNNAEAEGVFTDRGDLDFRVSTFRT
jgi:hypothetical protein